MTNIRIMRLVLDNFKCHSHLELVFNGRNASVYGDNATGKTSIYDALTWLLFGKDSAGNGEKNIEIKPLDSTGAVIDHSAITSVEAELQADGEGVTLKRTYREIWSTKRGSAQESFDGNTSEYFVNGVPCKKYVFDDQIKALVPEDVFRLLTSVGYFPDNLPWQKRRAVLFDMAGTRTDREIMKSIRSATADGTPVQGGGSGREDMMLSNIVQREELERSLEQAQKWVDLVDAGLDILSEEERLIKNWRSWPAIGKSTA